MIRAWSVGCSTGEEAYSLAIVFKEALDQIKPKGRFTLQIFATDLDSDAIDKARQGVYPANIAADVSPERLARFFVEEENGYRVGKEIRDMVTFATQNVIMDPPFTKLDILICRNLLIYLASDLQKKLLPLFHYILNPGGILFLGSAETISTFTDLFSPLDFKSRLFRRREILLPGEPVAFPHSFAPAPSEAQKESTMMKPAANLQSLADQLLLQRFSPPAVLANDKGDIVYISGRTGNIWSPRQARPTGTSSPWPGKGSALISPALSRRRSGKRRQSPSRASRSGPTAERRSSLSPSSRSKSRRRSGGW